MATNETTTEIWKPIPSFENYSVSSLGRVRSLVARQGSRAQRNDGVIAGDVQRLKAGYVRRCVTIRRNGKSFNKKVHRLVLEAFRGPCPHGMEGLHKNGDSLDNRISNLRWGTHQENVDDSVTHGTKADPPLICGETHPFAKLTADDVQYIRQQPRRHGLYAALARRFGVALGTVANIHQGTTRKRG